MFRYIKNKIFFAQISEDCSESGVQELKELGATNIEADYRGIYFEADKANLYEIVYSARLFSRFLAPLYKFDCPHDDILYEKAKSMEWDKILSPDKTFAIFANVGNSRIKHSQYAARRLKDAIADYFMEKCGKRPSVDTENPDVWLNLFINRDKAVINIDLAGGTGHKRGYRVTSVEAPMRETLAAAVIRYTGWDGEEPFYDPMCGSGTLLIEAMMHYCKIPALYKREKFGFQCLPDFDESLWDRVKRKVNEKIRPLPEGLIAGSDLDPEAIKAVLDNTSELPFGDRIEVTCKDYNDSGPLNNLTIVSNPPYGMRLDNDDGEMIKEFGDFLKQQCAGSIAWVYLGSTALVRRIGLRTNKRIMLNNGGLDGRLIKLEMYMGTRDP
jgi:putative N6-adenine-specific DNA methylase